jgi:type II secretory pathway pseudopilin PulG
MKYTTQAKLEAGFSVIELLVSMLILVPVMAAAIAVFSVGANQQSAERSSLDANQEARSAFEMMTREIAQAGSHGDASTTLTSAVAASTNAQATPVNSASGFTVGDYVDVDTGVNHELVQITDVSGNSISGIFRTAHASGVPVRLFALPYTTGMIPPAGMGANSSRTVTQVKFFGDIYSDSTLNYVEYAYDSYNMQITRSATPVTQATKNPAIPFVRNIKPGSVNFTLYTDNMGVVTSASVALTVQNTWKTGTKFQESQLSSRVVIPSAVAGSALWFESERFGGVDRLPGTPAHVISWAQ